MSLLPRVAPVLVRHLGAYVELLMQDLARGRAGFARQLTMLMIAAFGFAGAAVMLCVAILAASWDTTHRMTAVYSLLAFFVGLSGLAAAQAARLRSKQPPLFAGLEREWRLDRVLVARVLSNQDESQSAERPEADASGN